MIKFETFTPNSEFDEIYHQIFPDVTDKNGMFGRNAQWFCLKKYTTCNSDRGEIIAFCTIGFTQITKPVEYMVYNVGVNQHDRRKGYCTQLLSTLFEKIPAQRIGLFVNKNNRAAIKLYQKLGFVTTQRFYVPPAGEICMQRVPF
jgi:ribosomal protein S18 acetylase RimI-like enzyme